MTRRTRVAAVGGIALGVVAVWAVPATASSHHHTWQVKPGTGTISAAVAKARPGDRLDLAAGTFYDSVAIQMTLTIRGEGPSTVIKPPPAPHSPCDFGPSVEGLCVVGQVDSQGNPVPTNPVRDVQISGLRTTGFSDSGVFGLNTVGLSVTDVRSDHNGGYGIARFASTGTLFADNSASYNREAGLYVGDSPHADTTVRNNSADHNGYGLFVRDSTGATVRDNKTWGNCVGIMVLNSGHGATGPAGAGSHVIRDNQSWANDAACPAGDGPPTSGIGIALAGVQGTLVRDNHVWNNHPTGPSPGSGGIVILSTKLAGGSDPMNNTVRDNRLSGNQPADIAWDGSGTGNKATDNDCATAIPANLGWCANG